MSEQKDIWTIRQRFPIPVPADSIKMIEVPFHVPKNIDELLKQHWEELIHEHQKNLASQSINVTIRSQDNGMGALYDETGCVMWPGAVVSLQKILHTNNVIQLDVYHLDYTSVKGLRDPKVIEAFGNEKIPLPEEPFVIFTFPLTTDGKIALTLRGPKSFSKGLYHGVAGHPESSSISIYDHQKMELSEELLIKPSEYKREEMVFGGFIYSQRRKTELVGWLPINITSDKLKKRVDERPLSQRPTDSVGIGFIPKEPSKLRSYLKSTYALNLTSSARAALDLYLNFF